MYLSTQSLQMMRIIQKRLNRLEPKAEPQAVLLPGSPRPHDSIIVFPGSFNPPTNAHLALLKQARLYAREHEPMYLYAAISKQTVDKEHVERPLWVDRLLLLEMLLQHRVPHTGILLFNRGLYVEQAEAIRAAFPAVRRILFLLGFDKIVQIFDPHYYENRDEALQKLFALAELLVAPRGDDGAEALQALVQQAQNQRFAGFVHLLPFGEQYRYVSSTQIRQGTPAAWQEVPPEVRQFMRQTRAYAPPFRCPDGSKVDYYGERMKHLQRLLKNP